MTARPRRIAEVLFRVISGMATGIIDPKQCKIYSISILRSFDIITIASGQARWSCIRPVWYLRGSTSVSWNNPNGVFMDGYYGTPVNPVAWSYSHGNFHSDFLWCNFQPGQNFTMSTDLDSTIGGGYGAFFRQNRACGGTHMATSNWVSTTPPSEWCALYPTGQGC